MTDPQPNNAPIPDPAAGDWADIVRWRKAQRAALIAARLALPVATRSDYAGRIGDRLRDLLGDVRRRSVSFYWPIKGEPDLRPLMTALHDSGAICALPVVEEKGRPLTFRRWGPGAKMVRGVWNIPIPAAPDAVAPDIFLSPVVGFDPACYRLGYGGGFFDRTLAQAGPAACAIGVGYEQALLSTIHPQPHDIGFAAIVTEARVHTLA